MSVIISLVMSLLSFGKFRALSAGNANLREDCCMPVAIGLVNLWRHAKSLSPCGVIPQELRFLALRWLANIELIQALPTNEMRSSPQGSVFFPRYQSC